MQARYAVVGGITTPTAVFCTHDNRTSFCFELDL